MNDLSKHSSVEQQSQSSNDAFPPASKIRRQQNGVEFVTEERMSILGLGGPGLALAPPPGPDRLRQALNARLKRWSVTAKPLLAFVGGLRIPLQRAKPVLLERWRAAALHMQRARPVLLECGRAAALRMQQARHILLERWMAADFRSRQLPVLAIAATIWASTAWMAWRADDSATPLLRSRLAATRSQRVHPGEAAGAPASKMTAEPVDAQDAVRPESQTQSTSPSLSLDRIVDFLIHGPTPTPHGRPANPRLQVWADTHTGLYYCPGDGGYRQRSRGRFMSQKEAQNNSFQPASGASCP